VIYKKVFLDANILIDIRDDARNSHQISYELLDYFIEKGVTIYTSCDLITTIYYILSKKSRAHALDGIEKLNKICKVIEFSNKEIEKTTTLMRKNSKFKDLEDTLQYVLAQKQGCNLILSNDKAFYSEAIELHSAETLHKKLFS